MENNKNKDFLLANSAEWDADHVTLCYATMDVFDAYKLHRSNAFGQSRYTYADVLPKPASLARGANHKLFANALGLSNLYLLGNESLTATNIGIPGTVVNGTMPYQHQLIFDIEKEERNLYARELGNKLYEITDHLGNVRATISDRLALNNGIYEADLLSSSTYYPFGMSIGTLSDEGDYRFGFNGMEKDDEFKGSGNSYDFGARLFDSRMGRWLSVDPISNKYPGLSPFNFVGNNPIIFIDPDGEKIVWGETTREYKRIIKSAIRRWKKSDTYRQAWRELKQSEIVYNIEGVNKEPGLLDSWFPTFQGNRYSEMSFDDDEGGMSFIVGDKKPGGTISFNFFDTELAGTDRKGKKEFIFEGAGEEIIHAWQYDFYTKKYSNQNETMPGLGDFEWEGKSIKGIMKDEAKIPLSKGSDSILEKYGIELKNNRQSFKDYLGKGYEWRNNPKTFGDYRNDKKFPVKESEPELLKEVVK